MTYELILAQSGGTARNGNGLPRDCAASNDTGLGEQARQAAGGSEIVSGEPVQPSFLGVFVRKAIFFF